ncbi:hypothetical protein Tco_1241933 [Tanacetum coccineum]
MMMTRQWWGCGGDDGGDDGDSGVAVAVAVSGCGRGVGVVTGGDEKKLTIGRVVAMSGPCGVGGAAEWEARVVGSDRSW